LPTIATAIRHHPHQVFHGPTIPNTALYDQRYHYYPSQ
jgi:hypothetical protein